MPLYSSLLWLNLRVAGLATAGALLPGLWLAYLLATRPFTGRTAIQLLLASLLATPVVIVAAIVFPHALPWELLVAAGVLAAIPLIALGSHARLQSVDRDLGNAARSLGISEWRIFWRILLPLGWRPILAASAVAFARVLIERTIVAAL